MDAKADVIVDKIIVRGIAAVQLLICVVGLLIVPFGFMYGGAAVWPSRFQNAIGFLFLGLGIAFYLFSRQALARILSVLWYGVLIGLMVFRLSPAQTAKSGVVMFLLIWAALAALYLAVTSLGSVWEDARKNRVAAAYALLSILSLALVVAGFSYLTRETIGGLERQLHSSDSNARCMAAHSLGTKGAEAKNALPALKWMLDNTLCVNFGEFADDPAADIENIGGIDPLIEVMRDGGPLGRSAAAWHLRRVAGLYPDRAEDLKRAFEAGLKDEDGLVRQASVEGIGALGASGADLLPEVAKLVNDPQEQVRNSVVNATANSGSLSGLYALLANPDKQIRLQAIQELGYGSFGEAAIPALASALQDAAGPNSQQAADALAKFGRRALPALDSLKQAARSSPDQGARMAAIAALGKIGPEAYSCIASLSDDPDPQVSEYARKWKKSLEIRFPNLHGTP
jgi:HEAT repeat protein